MANDPISLIFTQLKDDMEKYISIENGYNNSPALVLRGLFGADEVKEYPCIGFEIVEEDGDDCLGKSGIVNLLVGVYGYTQVGGLDKIDIVRSLAHDTRYFILNDWTYKDMTEFVGKLSYGGGNSNVPASFYYNIQIDFEYTNNDIR